MRLGPGAVVDGRYTVLRELGTGGMATVWLVRHDRLQSLHALKVLSTTLPHLASRLMDEGRSQAALRHPNVVAVSDVIELDGLPALVMEYVDGPGLEQVQEEVGLALPQIDDLAAQLFAGMEAAHARGLTHRDLKPENLLVDLSRQQPVLKIADFGLVKVVREEQLGKTAHGTYMGTPWYMAPEQSRDASGVDHRADLFSAGAVLYELVTGKQAFPGRDIVDVFARMRAGTFTPIEELVPHTPERMITAIRWALEPDPAERCPDAAELRRSWFGGLPPPPPHAWEEPSWRMFVKRWRARALLLESAPSTRSATTPAGRPPEATKTELTPPVPAALPDEPRRWPWIAAAAALLGAVGVGWALSRSPGSPVPSPGIQGDAEPEAPPAVVVERPPAPAPEPAPLPAPADPPEPEVAPPEPPTLALLSPPPERPRPAPSPVVTAEPVGLPVPAVAEVVLPAPAPSPPPPPRFELQGAEGLTLALRRSDGRLVDLSAASPGTWTLLAFFDPLVPAEVASLELREGSVASVRCSAVARRCQARVTHAGGPP